MLLCISEVQCCYVSVKSKPDNPPGKPQGMFLKGRILHPLGTKKVRNPDPWGRKIVLKPHPGALIFEKPPKKEGMVMLRIYRYIIILCKYSTGSIDVAFHSQCADCVYYLFHNQPRSFSCLYMLEVTSVT